MKHKVEKLVFYQLKLKKITVKHEYRAGSPETNHTRPFIARLQSENQKLTCSQTSIKLKITDIYLGDDVSKVTQSIKCKKLTKIKEECKEGFIANFFGID